MTRLFMISAVVLGLAVVSSPALADVQWYVFDLRRQQCFNTAERFTPEQSIRGCSDVISMRSVTGDGRAQAYKLRGDHYRRLGEYDRALADYTQVIRMRGDHPGAYYRRAEVYVALGRYEDAMADATRVIETASDTPGGYRVRCEIIVAQNGDLAAARQDCNQALEINSIDTQALAARGVLNLRSRQFQEAWTDFDAAIFNGRREARTLYGRGIAANRIGRPREGAADIEAAQALQPEVSAQFASYGVTP